MKGKWFENSYRRNLIDMHIPDWDHGFMKEFDAENYVNMLSLAKVDTAYIYSSSCLGISYWPAKTGHMHGGLNGRDALGEMISGCHNRGMKVVVYYNFWSKWAYDNHPDWRTISAKGEGTAEYLWTVGRYGVCCPNSPYRDYVLAQIEDLCKSYEFEGLWIDMILWPYTVCYCSHCRKRYAAEIGGEIPRIVNWEDPKWIALQRKREEWLAEFAGRITSTAKRVKPEITVGHQCAGWSTGWQGGFSLPFFQKSDYLSGDFYGGALEQSFVCKLFHSIADHGAFEFMTSRCPDLNDHTTMKQKELLEAQVYLTLAHKGGFLFIDAIDPAGTLNESVYRRMGEIFGGVKKYEKYLEGQMELCCDAGIYMNFESLRTAEDNGKNIMEAAAEIPFVKRAVRIAKSLLNEHIPFGIVTDKNLEELFKYQVIILPDSLAMDEEEALKLKEYVNAGGSVYASRNASLYTKDGQKSDDFLLSDLFGISYAGETEENITYMAPGEEDGNIFLNYSDKYPLTIYGSQAKVTMNKENAEATVLATITLPYTNPGDPEKFASAISNPPGKATNLPAIVLNKYGKGKVLYTSGNLECMESEDHRKVFANMVGMLANKPLCFLLNAPKPVEMTLLHQREEKRYILSLVNFQSELPNIPIDGIKAGILLKDKKPFELKLLPDETHVHHEMKDGYLEFTSPKLDTFLMFELKYI